MLRLMVRLLVRDASSQIDCFKRYVATKVNKRVESNKLRATFKDAPRSLLLPVSFGSSSLSLFHILDQQLRDQKNRTGRCSFQIEVLFIDQAAVVQQDEYEEVWKSLKERFPSHSYSVARLEDVFDYITDLPRDGPALDTAMTDGTILSKQQNLENFLSSLPSATSRTDMIGILRSRLITSLATDHGCEFILYGDSTTRLAERTLSETAKGRGGAIPWLTADGQSPHGVRTVYPMRDLLRKEIVAYAGMADPPLTPLLLQQKGAPNVVTSSKNTTIDDLMAQYFGSVEQNYPSVVANVVRTSSRLEAPLPKSRAGRLCSVCRLPLAQGTEGLRWSGDQGSPERHVDLGQSRDAAASCYGCARAMLNT
ncbi:MAG: hypothetical protein LQ341_005065 [Variospora aurantia]|nr:MAG: hypothetical protein LQ341_005065 [Variospora aurantia]